MLTHNRLPLLQKAILSLRAQIHPLDTILVVDNGSTDGTADWLARQSGLTVITQGNEGSAGGFATVIETLQARTDLDWVLLLDDDCAPDPGYVSTLLDAAGQQHHHPDDLTCWSGWIDEPGIGMGRIFPG
jgi:GT2 family glycosyltransferase